MKYLLIVAVSLFTLASCGNPTEKDIIEANSEVEYTPGVANEQGDFSDDTTGVMIEKDTLPVIVKEAEKKD